MSENQSLENRNSSTEMTKENGLAHHIMFETYEGTAGTKNQIGATSGSIVGESSRETNKGKILYGLLKGPEIPRISLQEEEEEEKTKDEAVNIVLPKNRKREHLSKKTKSDPNSPPLDRMPLPPPTNADKVEKAKALPEASKRITLGPDRLPSICIHTVLNCESSVTSTDISEDSSLLALGFCHSSIKVWTLTTKKILSMKSGKELKDVDPDADDVFIRIIDRSSGTSDNRVLLGHFGPVYSLSFSPRGDFLLSSSADGSVRIWSLLTWTCSMCYKGPVLPVWSVSFSPDGNYFATGFCDKTVRLWATNSNKNLRTFVGHHSEVNIVKFHPNMNYIATGSSDSTVRLWDCDSGDQMRVMTGHKETIFSLAFSTDGRFLASAGADFRVLLWDHADGHLVADLPGHTGPIHCLSFSRDGNHLVSGSLDSTLKIWDFTKLADVMSLEDVNVSHNPAVKTASDSYLLKTFPTKNYPILGLHFTRSNLMFAIGSCKRAS